MRKPLTPEQKERKRIKDKERYMRNREQYLLQYKEYRQKTKEKRAIKNREYHQKNKEQIKERKRKWYEENKETAKLKNKVWRENNKEKILKYNIEYEKRMCKTNTLYKLKNRTRKIIRETINNMGFKKSSKTEQILGCSFDEFKLYIESKFESWMNWDNYGDPKDGIVEPNKTWDIDHIIPLKTAITVEDIIKLNHYTNLQPLCSYQNRFVKKGNING